MTYHAIILTDVITEYRTKPLGAYTVANVLRMQGYKVLVIDHISKIDIQELLSLLKKFITKDTLFLGYSSTFFPAIGYSNPPIFPLPYDNIRLINQTAKDLNPSISVLIGGVYARRLTTYNLENNDTLGFTHVMYGFAEVMIVDFTKSLEQKRIPRFSNKSNGLYVIEYNVTSDGFDFKNYKHIWDETDFVFQNEALPIELGRGCIFKCKFCAYPLVGKDPRDTSYIRDEEVLLAEVLENYERFKTTTYLVVDDTFNERDEKLEVLLRVRDRSKLDLNFTGYNRIDLIARRPRQLSMLKDLNFNGLFFGIESMNYESAKAIGKGIKPAEITETLHKIRDAFNNKLTISAGFIIGLPYETPETFYKWFREVQDPNYPIDSVILNYLGIYKTSTSSSDFYDNPEKFGYTVTPNTTMWKNDIWDSEICKSIAVEERRNMIINSRLTLNNFEIASFPILGYPFETMLKTKYPFYRRLDYIERKQSVITEYFNKLKNLS